MPLMGRTMAFDGARTSSAKLDAFYRASEDLSGRGPTPCPAYARETRSAAKALAQKKYCGAVGN